MKQIFYSFALILVFSFMIISCKKSPANICVGEYHGNYSFDSTAAGACTTKVTEVNSLTVNFIITGDSLSETSLTDVQVNGGDEPYSLLYTGIEGSLTGTVTSDEMHWTLNGVNDTIKFVGTKN